MLGVCPSFLCLSLGLQTSPCAFLPRARPAAEVYSDCRCWMFSVLRLGFTDGARSPTSAPHAVGYCLRRLCCCAQASLVRKLVDAPVVGCAMLLTHRSCIGMVAWRPSTLVFVGVSRSCCGWAGGAMHVVLLKFGPGSFLERGLQVGERTDNRIWDYLASAWSGVNAASTLCIPLDGARLGGLRGSTWCAHSGMRRRRRRCGADLRFCAGSFGTSAS